MQRELAAALEMQRKAEEEAAALKVELELATSSNEEKMHALTETVRLHISKWDWLNDAMRSPANLTMISNSVFFHRKS